MEEILQIPRHADGFAGITRGTRMRQAHRHRELEVNLVLTGRRPISLAAGACRFRRAR